MLNTTDLDKCNARLFLFY